MMKTNRIAPLVSAWSAIADWRGMVRRGRPLRLSRHVTSTLKLLLLVVAATWSGKALADATKLPELSTTNSPKYYVIQNANSKNYVTYKSGGDPRIQVISSVTDATLWIFVSANNSTSVSAGTLLVPKNLINTSKKYLTDGTTFMSNDIGTYSESGTTFYINPNPYDIAGCVVSTTAGTPVDGTKKCMELDSDPSNDHIRLSNLENQDYFKWIFKSYDDLLNEALSGGFTTIYDDYKDKNQTEAANFRDLIQALNDAKANVAVATPTTGKKLFRNRRTGLYLNSNGTRLYGVKAPTQYSLWNKNDDGGIVLKNIGANINLRHNTSLYADNAEPYSLDPDVGSIFSPSFSKSSDGDPRYVKIGYTDGSNTYYMGMNAGNNYVLSRTSTGITSDWEVIEVTTLNYPYPATNKEYPIYTYTREGVTYQFMNSIVDDSELTEAPYFFRIRNVARSVVNYDEDVFDGGGWLEDVDHIHATVRKYEVKEGEIDDLIYYRSFDFDGERAELYWNGRRPEFYAAESDLSHASALWQFEKVGHGVGGGENATGLLSSEHDIFIIQNANTGAYIKAGVDDVSGVYFLQSTKDKDEAAKFFINEMIDGQYSINWYTSTNTTTGEDNITGWLTVEGSAAGYQGGLTFNAASTAKTDGMNTNAGWIISPAPMLKLKFLIRDVEVENDDNNQPKNDFANYNWTTFYYPFDVEVAMKNDVSQTVEFCEGSWVTGNKVYEGSVKSGAVTLLPIGYVPGGQAVFARTQSAYTDVILNAYPKGQIPESRLSAIGSSRLTDDDFQDNVWNGVVESDNAPVKWIPDFDVVAGTPGEENTNWRNVWVLSKNRAGYLRLSHPSGHYLLPNRSYLDAKTVQNAGLTSFSTFEIDGFGDTTGIEEIDNTPSVAGHSVQGVYDLQGRKVNLSTTKPGLYIVNGKKMLVK